MRESTVEATTCRWAREHGIIVIKLSGANARGQPDRLFLRNRVAALIEFKAPGGRLSPLQRRWLVKLAGHGFPAEWFDDSGKAIAWLEGVFHV